MGGFETVEVIRHTAIGASMVESVVEWTRSAEVEA
jgi:hypothetical protein